MKFPRKCECERELGSPVRRATLRWNGKQQLYKPAHSAGRGGRRQLEAVLWMNWKCGKRKEEKKGAANLRNCGAV
jgi:hypothetical protein